MLLAGLQRDGLSALDLLSASSLVNYFGKVDKVDQIKLDPILISKGKTRLAIYGLGNIRDERLHNTIKKKQLQLSVRLASDHASRRRKKRRKRMIGLDEKSKRDP